MAHAILQGMVARDAGIENDEFGITNDEFWIENDELCMKVTSSASPASLGAITTARPLTS